MPKREAHNEDLLAVEETPYGSQPLLVTRKDACRLLGGICVKSLENIIKAGRLPTVKIRRRTMIPRWALVKYARQGDKSAK